MLSLIVADPCDSKFPENQRWDSH